MASIASTPDALAGGEGAAPVAVPSPPASRLPNECVNVAQLQDHLGGIPLERIRLQPPPGFATPADVTWLDDHADVLCELIDGVLVEKTMGWVESFVAVTISTKLNAHVLERNLGFVLGADGTLQILPDQVRIPDVCFIGWNRFPDGKLPREPIPNLVPDLAVEILSESNRPGEMQRKLREYFAAGGRLVWYVDPESRTVRVYTSPEQVAELHEPDELDGGDVLPGFRLPLAVVFALPSPPPQSPPAT